MADLGGFLFFGNVDAEGQLEAEDDFWADDEIRQSLAAISGRTASLSLNRELASLEAIAEDVREAVPESGSDDGGESLMDVDVDEELLSPTPSSESAMVPVNKRMHFTSLFSLGQMHRYKRLKRLRIRRKMLHGKVFAYAPDESELFASGQPVRHWHERFALSLTAIAAQLSGKAASAANKKSSRLQHSVLEAIRSASASTPTDVPRAPRPLSLTSVDWHAFNAVNLVVWEEWVVHDDSRPVPKPSALVPLYSEARHPDPGLPLSAPTSRPPSRTMSLSSNITVSAIASGTLTAAQAAAMLSPMPLPRRPVIGPFASSSSQMTSPVGAMSSLASPLASSQTAGASVRNLATRIINLDLEFGAWERDVILDEAQVTQPPNAKLQLNLNDPALIFEAVELDTRKLTRAERLIAKRLRKLKGPPDGHSNAHASGGGSGGSGHNAANRVIVTSYSRPIGDRFNLSNDKFYVSGDSRLPAYMQAKKAASQSTLGHSRLSLQHSVPALKLLPPHFKTWLDKPDGRQWHRPDVFFPLKEMLKFSAIKARRPQATSSAGRAAQVIRKTKDLTVRDGAPCVVVEFSEQWPLILQNVGMAAFVYQYYRKRDASDDFFFADNPEEDSTGGMIMSREGGSMISTGKDNAMDVGFGVVLEPGDPSPLAPFGDVTPGQRLYVLSNNLFRAPLFRHSPHEGDFLAIRFTYKGKTTYALREMPPLLTAGQVLPAMEVYAPHSRRLNQASRNRVQVAAYRLAQRDPQGWRLRIPRLLAAFPQFSEPSLRKWLKEYCEVVKGSGSQVWVLKPTAPKLSEDDLRALFTPEQACLLDAMQVGQQRLQDLQLEEDARAPWTLSANLLSCLDGKCMLQISPTANVHNNSSSIAGITNATRDTSHSQQQQDPNVFFNLQKVEEPPRGKGNRQRASGEQLMQHKARMAQAWRAMQQTLQRPPHGPLDVAIVPRDYFDFDLDDASANPNLDDDGGSESTTTMHRKRLVITRQVLLGEQMVTQTEEITDGRVIALYLRQQSSVAIRRKRRLQAYQASRAKKPKRPAVASGREKKKPPRPPADVRCGACGQLGHMRTNRECPLLKIEAPVRMQGSKLTISLDSLKRVEAERSKAVRAMSLKLPSRIVSAATAASGASSGQATPPPLPSGPKRREERLKVKRIPLWQFILTQANDDGVKRDLAVFNDRLAGVLNVLRQEADSWPFHKPVSRKQYPLYYRIIRKPTDLQTMQRSCRQRKFVSADEFLDRLRLMASNCRQYNGDEHPFTQTAQRLIAVAEQALQSSRDRWQPLVDRLHGILASSPSPPPQPPANVSDISATEPANGKEDDHVTIPKDENVEVEGQRDT